MGNIIETKDLRYFYRSTDDAVPQMVLNGVDLAIEEGTFVAILGHNGSGKSTLAKQFNAVLLPEGGNVYVGGLDTKDENLLLEIRRQVGLVFQNPDNQIVSNVVEEDVAFAPENLGCPPEEIRTQFLFLADGKGRKLEKPKRKKEKHVRWVPLSSSPIPRVYPTA